MECQVNGVCGVVRIPEVKQVGANKVSVCKPTVVFERNYKQKDGEWGSDKCFVQLELWGAMAERFVESMSTGDECFVSGSLGINQWEDSDGKKRSQHFIKPSKVVKTVKNKSQSDDRPREEPRRPSKKQNQAKAAPAPVANNEPDDDYDLPF